MAHSGKSITFGADLLPNEDNIYNLGTTNQTWKIFGTLTGTATSWASATTVYVNLASSGTNSTLQGGESSAVTLKVDGTLGTGNGGLGNNSFTKNRLLYTESATKISSTTSIYASTDAITINGTSTPANSGKFQVKGTSTMQHIYPESDAGTTAYNIGSDAIRWSSLYLATSLLVGAKNTITAYNSNAKGSFVGPAVFSVCVTAAGDGYYIMGASQQYARMYIGTLGTTSATGLTYLELGNNKNSTTAKNSRGIVRLYSDNTTYTDIQSQLTKSGNSNSNKTFYLPQYTGTDQMYAVHAGNNNAVGSTTKPVYVAAGGRVTESDGTVGNPYIPTYLNGGTITQVYPIQYNTFTIASGTRSVTLENEAYNIYGEDNIEVIVLTIVVISGESYLKDPITASTQQKANSQTIGQVILTTDTVVSGDVVGYILTARGKDLTSSS